MPVAVSTSRATGCTSSTATPPCGAVCAAPRASASGPRSGCPGTTHGDRDVRPTGLMGIRVVGSGNPARRPPMRSELETLGRHARPLHGVLGWWAVTSFGLLSVLVAALTAFWPTSVRAVGAAALGAWLLFTACGRPGGGPVLPAPDRGPPPPPAAP